jgi:hypothetical protein
MIALLTPPFSPLSSMSVERKELLMGDTAGLLLDEEEKTTLVD